MEVPLLRAKLTVPAAPASFVQRAALLDRLETSRKSGSKASLVVAPAGYGKTTLAGAWIARAGLTAGWLTLDGRDNLPARFFRYLVAALETPFPGLEERLAPLMRAPASPPTDTLVEAIVGAIEDSRKRPRPQGLLVLDDLHAVKEPSLHDALDLFIEYLPEALHVILLSREPPPLRLQKLRARGALTEIGQAELELGREEAARLLREVAGTEVAPEVAEDSLPHHRRVGHRAPVRRAAHCRSRVTDEPAEARSPAAWPAAARWATTGRSSTSSSRRSSPASLPSCASSSSDPRSSSGSRPRCAKPSWAATDLVGQDRGERPVRVRRSTRRGNGSATTRCSATC